MFCSLHTLAHGPLTATIYAEPPRWVVKIFASEVERMSVASPDTPQNSALVGEELMVAAATVRLESSDESHVFEWPKVDPLGDPVEAMDALKARAKLLNMVPRTFYNKIAKEVSTRGGLNEAEKGK